MKRLAYLMALGLALPAFAHPPASDAFAVKLYQALDHQPGNLALSPYSVAAAVAMAGVGAQGQTQAELDAALGVADSGQLAALGAAPDPDVRVANALWVKQGVALKDSYRAELAERFGAKAALLDFARPDEAARTMNDWVAAKTDGKITGLVPAASLNGDTRLVLTNAVYFKGAWHYFNKADTDQAVFHAGPGTDETVAMMQDTDELKLAQGDGVQVLELPYEAGGAELDVVLPNQRFGLARLEAGLTAPELEGWLEAAQPMPVAVSLPRFTVTGDFDLNAALSGLGMSRAFDPAKAEFGAIADLRAGQRLFISDVLHKAYVAVDETGTEAAAATAVEVMMATAEPPGPAVTPVTFVADHPFLFLIRAVPGGQILFMGRVDDPASGSR